MSILYIAIPVALMVASAAIIAFVIQVQSGQYDDMQTPSIRMLFDDEPLDSVTNDNLLNDNLLNDVRLDDVRLDDVDC